MCTRLIPLTCAQEFPLIHLVLSIFIKELSASTKGAPIRSGSTEVTLVAVSMVGRRA
jgi:hypothetical protein